MADWRIWENPIVISSFRLRYRVSSPTTYASCYAGLLLVIVVSLLTWPYGKPYDKVEFAQQIAAVVLGAQMLLSGGLALFTTQAAIRGEVVNRTLDFQRISSLSPRTFLLGKMLGEPVLAYFTIFSTVPVIVLLSLIGQTSPIYYLPLYIQILTFTIFASSLGLIFPLQIGSNTGTGVNPNTVGFGALAGALVPACFPFILMVGRFASRPAVAATFGVGTPFTAVFWYYKRQPHLNTLDLDGWPIPLFLVAPIVQLALSAVMLVIMIRQLIHPQYPLLSKPITYLLAICFQCWWLILLRAEAITGNWPENFLLAVYWIGYGVFATILMMASTPNGEIRQSWIWQYRGKVPFWRDWLLGDRSDNTLQVLLLGLIGLLGLVGIHYWVVINVKTPSVTWLRSIPFNELSARLAVVSFLSLLVFGSTFQFSIFRWRQSGAAIWALGQLLLMLLPLIALLIVELVALRYWDGMNRDSMRQFARFYLTISLISHFNLSNRFYTPDLPVFLVVFGLIFSLTIRWHWLWYQKLVQLISAKQLMMTIPVIPLPNPKLNPETGAPVLLPEKPSISSSEEFVPRLPPVTLSNEQFVQMFRDMGIQAIAINPATVPNLPPTPTTSDPAAAPESP